MSSPSIKESNRITFCHLEELEESRSDESAGCKQSKHERVEENNNTNTNLVQWESDLNERINRNVSFWCK